MSITNQRRKSFLNNKGLKQSIIPEVEDHLENDNESQIGKAKTATTTLVLNQDQQQVKQSSADDLEET